jgi:hypothetical protein
MWLSYGFLKYLRAVNTIITIPQCGFLWFPEMGIPLNHPFWLGIFHVNHPSIGVGPPLETPKKGHGGVAAGVARQEETRFYMAELLEVVDLSGQRLLLGCHGFQTNPYNVRPPR